MSLVPKSGLYNPSKFGLIMIKAFDSVIGKNGMDVIFNISGLIELMDHYPEDNLERTFDFSNVSSINTALEVMYGTHSARNIAEQVGRAAFEDTQKNFGVLIGAQDLSFKILPLHMKIKSGLLSAVKLINQVSDQVTTVTENEFDFVLTVHQCPVCWGRENVTGSVCNLTIGLLKESLCWVSSGKEFEVIETKCKASGDTVCEFVIQKEPLT